MNAGLIDKEGYVRIVLKSDHECKYGFEHRRLPMTVHERVIALGMLQALIAADLVPGDAELFKSKGAGHPRARHGG